MADTLRDVMTDNPATLESSVSAIEAAGIMRDRDVGDVIVMESGSIYGIVTDRDLVVRVIADGRDPKTTKLSECCSREIESLPPDAGIREAVDLMTRRSLRRIPVVSEARPVGIVSLGDLAVERDPNSAVGKISAADPNR